jgi:hypothetical protein
MVALLPAKCSRKISFDGPLVQANEENGPEKTFLTWFGMETYDAEKFKEMQRWQEKMLKRSSYVNRLTQKVQNKINSYIPEKVHVGITKAIREMFRAVLFGAQFTSGRPRLEGSLELREAIVLERINFYKKTAAAEGGITGAGGILLGLADFPLLLGIKIKLLFEIAPIYGFDVQDYKERLFLLNVFQLAFCSHETRRQTFLHMQDWAAKAAGLPADIKQLDWRTLQQEYRDYIDLAKMAQLVPVIGAPVGAVANYHLIKKLGTTAMNAYRMRIFEARSLPSPGK